MGTHRYHFFIHCPVIYQEDTSTEWIYFNVTEEAQEFVGPVYFRLAGLSTGVLDAINVLEISPAQETLAVVTIVGITEHISEVVAESCEILVRWDDKSPQSMTAGEPFKP
jgi:hypothetical protein